MCPRLLDVALLMYEARYASPDIVSLILDFFPGIREAFIVLLIAYVLSLRQHFLCATHSVGVLLMRESKEAPGCLSSLGLCSAAYPRSVQAISIARSRSIPAS